MRHLKYMLTAAIAAALAFASCTKEIEAPDQTGQEEESYSRETGAPVVFGVSTGDDNEAQTKAEEYSEEIFTSVNGELQKIGEVSTGYDEGPETKAKYSGYTYDGKERIDWELNDRIQIRCREVSSPSNLKAEYKISQRLSNAGRESKAKIENVGEGLKWGNLDRHRFWGFYPVVESIDDTHFWFLGASDGWIRGFVPYEQPAKNKPLKPLKPLLLAYNEVDKSTNTPVNLNFTPVVNTFDIKLTNGLASTIDIEQIRLYSALNMISGAFKIYKEKYSPFEYYHNKSENHVHHYNSISLSPGKTYSLRLYTIPEDIHDLTIEIVDKNGKLRRLRLKDKNNNWIRFRKCMKYNLDIRIEEVTYIGEEKFILGPVDHIDTIRILPYEKGPRNWGYYSEKCRKVHEGIPIKSYILINDRWSRPADWTIHENGLYSYEAVLAYHHYDQKKSEQTFFPYKGIFPLKNAKDDFKRKKYKTETLAELRSRKPENFVYDLSREGGRSTGVMNTANCYRITKAGKYKFPLIYGNSIKDDDLNTSAFSPFEDASSDVPFVDGAGYEINEYNYEISRATSVKMLWHDESTPPLVSLELTNEGDEGQYVQFEISQHNIAYGNYFIAVTNPAGTILWTWHIWVVPNIDDNGLLSKQISKRPLGHRPDMGGTERYSTYLHLYPVEAKDISYSLIKIELKRKISYSRGSCPYYTYGRMTPTPMSTGFYLKGVTATSIPRELSELEWPEGTNFTAPPARPSLTSYAHAISSPGHLETVKEINRDMSIQYPWLGVDAIEDVEENNYHKTVYDPCPAGYRVPSDKDMERINLRDWPAYGTVVPYQKKGQTIDMVASAFTYTSAMYTADGTVHTYNSASGRYHSAPYYQAGSGYAPIFPMKE